MKSLLERATARPLPFLGLIIAVIAILFIIWWLLSPSAKQNVTQPTTSIIANQKIIAPVKQPDAVSAPAPTSANANDTVEKTNAVPASSPASTTPPAAPTPTVPAINAALPKDSATAAEELDRLKDEQGRLKERKKDLAKQLAISNKLLALKDQQLKDLSQTNP